MGVNGFVHLDLCVSPETYADTIVEEMLSFLHQQTPQAYRKLGALVGTCYFRFQRTDLPPEEYREMAKKHALALELGSVLDAEIPYEERPLIKAFLEGWIQGYDR